MACSEHIQSIGAYHDGELPPAEARELEQHLLQCPACRRELERLRALSAWLAAARAPRVDAAAIERLRHGLRPRREWAVLRTARALTAAAAAVLIVCSALLWRGRQVAPQPVQPLARWEAAAVVPAQPASDAALGSGGETNADAELVQLILSSASLERGTRP